MDHWVSICLQVLPGSTLQAFFLIRTSFKKVNELRHFKFRVSHCTNTPLLHDFLKPLDSEFVVIFSGCELWHFFIFRKSRIPDWWPSLLPNFDDFMSLVIQFSFRVSWFLPFVVLENSLPTFCTESVFRCISLIIWCYFWKELLREKKKISFLPLQRWTFWDSHASEQRNEDGRQ